MKESINRILAISIKEWRLNTRFVTEYIASNLVAPIKSALLLYFIYAGLLKDSSLSLGLLNGQNFSLYVIIGSTCHSLFISSLYIFRSKMVMERWWQTFTATLVSPATTLEVIGGFILGSGSVNILLSTVILSLISYFFDVPFTAFLIATATLVLLALFSFGIGLIGATIVLCWEGKSFIFDYSLQALIFMSCFYYPLEALPSILHSTVKILPTYCAVQLMQELILTGQTSNIFFKLSYLTVGCLFALSIPAFFFSHSVKKYGVVGY